MNPARIAEICARVIAWHAARPNKAHKVFTCTELTTTGYTLRQLRFPLALLGWQRAEVWSRRNNRRVKRVLYAPPGHRIPRPPRGRPRFSLTDYLTITIL